jgi:hypothetical protein
MKIHTREQEIRKMRAYSVPENQSNPLSNSLKILLKMRIQHTKKTAYKKKSIG